MKMITFTTYWPTEIVAVDESSRFVIFCASLGTHCTVSVPTHFLLQAKLHCRIQLQICHWHEQHLQQGGSAPVQPPDVAPVTALWGRCRPRNHIRRQERAGGCRHHGHDDADLCNFRPGRRGDVTCAGQPAAGPGRQHLLLLQ